MDADTRTPAPATAVVVLAGGGGTRLGAGINKVYLDLAGRTVLGRSVATAAAVPGVRRVVVVLREEDAALAREVLARDCPGVPVETVTGGATRHASEEAALALLEPAIRSGALQLVAIHDGARPLAGPDLYRRVLDAALADGGALPALPADGAVPGPDGDPDPRGTRLVRVQTPQAFRAGVLLDAYREARRTGRQGTDTASSVLAHGRVRVRTVPGSCQNLKITYPQDLELARALLPSPGPAAAPVPGAPAAG